MRTFETDLTVGAAGVAEPALPVVTTERVKRVKRAAPGRFAQHPTEPDYGSRQAELFYLQKQIQQQTQMVFVMEDGQRIQGVIEWYDKNSIKVRGRQRVLIYKSAIKYIQKMGEVGMSPEWH